MPLARLLALTAALLASQALAKRAPDFDVRDLAGRHYTLAGLSGKVVVLNFWFKGCPPCRRERPELNRLVAQYQGVQDVVFLAPALDEADELRDFLEDNPLRYAVIPDSARLAEAFGVSGFPTHVVIGRDGSIARSWVGATDPFYRLTEAINAETQRPITPEPGPSSLARRAARSPVLEPILLALPERPRRGETVKLFYSPQSLELPAEAQLAWDIHGDDSFTQGVAPLRTRGVLLSSELKLPADATLVHLRVISRTDRRIVEYTLPVTDASGQPVRNAFINLGACDMPLPVEYELARYPGNPFALLARFEERLRQPGTTAETARAELRSLLRTAEARTLELLAVTADALLLTGDLQAVPQVLDTMELLDRDAFLTRRTLFRLVTQPSGERWRQWPAGLLSSAWKRLAERDDVWSRRAASQLTAPGMDTDSAEKICATWQAAEPDNPFAHDCLARLLERQGRLQEALGARRSAIEAVSAGKLPLYLAGGWSQLARAEEELWARHAELSLAARSQPELAGPIDP